MGTEVRYDTHFLCALCGGPFAQVFRTAVDCHPQPQPPDEEGSASKDVQYPDTDLENEFNIPEDENCIVPAEAVQDGMSYIARRSRARRIRAQRARPRMFAQSEPRVVQRAYDGRRISAKQMEWTRCLRALICTEAKHQPRGWEDAYNEEDNGAYLTGRGMVRQWDRTADAYPSVDSESTGDEMLPVPEFDGSARARDEFKFEMYQGQPQSVSSTKTDGFISSIPFHDECWSMFDIAIEESRAELGLPRTDSEDDERSITPGHMWRYLRDLIAVSGVKQEITISRGQYITRLSEIDYREAQSSGEGWKWMHEDGYHWLVADPSRCSVLENPVQLKPAPVTNVADPSQCSVLENPIQLNPAPVTNATAPRSLPGDPFMCLPAEMLIMISQYLSAADIFSLRIASPAVCVAGLPDWFYKRFLRTEFGHVEKLRIRLDEEENIPIIKSEVDWRGTWEKLRSLVRTPRNPNDPDEWKCVDIGLKNRCRIWKIVKPIAEVLVHTSPDVLFNLHQAPQDVISATTLVRGFMGTRSGKEGRMENVYLRGAAYRKRIPSDDEGQPESKVVECEQSSAIKSITIWYDKGPKEFEFSRGNKWFDVKDEASTFCGLGFHIESDVYETRIFGRKGPRCEEFKNRAQDLRGFGFCLVDSIITGIKILYDEAPRSRMPSQSKTYGFWPENGFVRQIIVPKDWRKLCGMIGFMNSAGYFETIGLLEQKLTHDSLGRPLPDAPMNVPLSHEEASLWKGKPPPLDVVLLEREGPVIPNWRLKGAEFEIWDHQSSPLDCNYSFRGTRLYKITGWADERALRGLEFHYWDRKNRIKTTRILGCRRGTPNVFKVSYQNIHAMVVGVSDEGIHSVHFVTNGGRVSSSLGPRYKGTHKVFAPLPEGAERSTARRDDLHEKIVGVHVLWDEENERFLQLGIITLPDDGGRDPPVVISAIPFDEASDVDGVWCDGKPPSSWITGAKQTFSGGSTQHAAPIPAYRAAFSGWVSFRGVCTVTIYGRMEGIRFSYHDNRQDQYFGNVEARTASVQHFHRNERIIDLAVEDQASDSQDTCLDENESITSASSIEGHSFLPQLLFLSKYTFIPSGYSQTIDGAACNFLQGIRFDFNANMIIDWAPAFDASSEDDRGDLMNFARLPWDTDEFFPDDQCQIATNSECYHLTFDPSDGRPVTAIRGYVDRMGKFAGLHLRRGNEWDSQVFGRPMGCEVEVFELGQGEAIDGIYLTGEPSGGQTFTAMALTTTAARCTPWIGNPGKENVFYRTPPSSYTVAGIFGTFPQIPYQSAPTWDSLGLLWRITDENEYLETPPPTPNSVDHPPRVLPGLPYGQVEPNANLRWFVNPPPHLTRSSLHMPAPSVKNPELGCTFCIIDPSKLLQIQFYITAMLGVAGIRFKGTAEMGTVTFNSWPDVEGTRMRRRDKMKIDGPSGERIIKIDGYYQDGHVVGIEIVTSFGRAKKFMASSQFPRRSEEIEVKTMEIGNGRRLAGFWGVAARYRIYDLGLMSEEIPAIERPVLEKAEAPEKPAVEVTADSWSWSTVA